MNTNKTPSAKAVRFSFLGLSAAALTVAALLGGCNKKEPATPARQSSVSSEVKVEAQKAVDGTKEMAEDAKEALKDAGEKVEEGAKKAVEATKDAVDDAKKSATEG